MVQMGLTTSMIGLAVGQLFFGPLSDKYGRRRPLLAAMTLFLISTVLCIAARNIEQFVVLRFIQGVAASGGIVISRSVATDQFSGVELGRMLAVIGAINGVAPVTAPIIGGALTDRIGWQGIFCILLALGLVLLAGCWRYRETLPAERRSSVAWRDILHGFGNVLRNRRFVGYVLQFGFAQGVLFAHRPRPRPSLRRNTTDSRPSDSASALLPMPWQSVWLRLRPCVSAVRNRAH